LNLTPMKVIDPSSVAPRTRIRLCIKGLATVDVFPEFSKKVRTLLYNPLGVLICTALVALLCGFFLHWQCFLLFGSVLSVIVLGSAWPFLTLRMIRGTISFERRRATEGERVQSWLTIRNRMFWPAYGLAMREGLRCHDDTTDDRPLVGIASTPPRRTVRRGWFFTPERRGVYPLSTPRLSSGFPFGLWQSKRDLSCEAPLLVWPRTYLVGPVPTVQGDQQLEGVVSRSKVGNSGDVLGVRPYRRGDSLRRIHWAQSARHDRLIVCELQANARPVVQLVLDTDPRVHVGDGPDGSREWAIRVLASLAKGWLTAGATLGVAWDRHIIAPSSGSRHLETLLDALAKIPDSTESTLAEELDAAACRNFADGLQVIVTTDRGATCAGRPSHAGNHQRWIILRSRGFCDSSSLTSAEPSLPFRPWLLIDTPADVPVMLRGWKESVDDL
jgi:uncharacterized protein (DUF58 family)